MAGQMELLMAMQLVGWKVRMMVLKKVDQMVDLMVLLMVGMLIV